MMKIVKRGKSKNHNGREYILVKHTGDTLLSDMLKRYGKNYHPGMTGAEKRKDGYYYQLLWKREKPLSNTKKIKGYWNW